MQNLEQVARKKKGYCERWSLYNIQSTDWKTRKKNLINYQPSPSPPPPPHYQKIKKKKKKKKKRVALDAILVIFAWGL